MVWTGVRLKRRKWRIDMSQLKVYGMPVGEIGANCYFVVNEETKEAFCVDAGAEGEKLCEIVKQHGWKLCGILLTHGHADHITAAEFLKIQTGNPPIYAAKAEERVLADPALNLTTMFGQTISLKADQLLADGEKIELVGTTITCILTSGHTEGGMCYYLEKEKILFTGDTLFQQSIGRTDFPTGSYEQLERSIREKLYILPENTKVYTGHDSPTTIGDEKQHNMFVRG